MQAPLVNPANEQRSTGGFIGTTMGYNPVIHAIRGPPHGHCQP
jgi:hypothetical protein